MAPCAASTPARISAGHRGDVVLAWLPLALLVLLLVISVLIGRAPVPVAHAASTGTVDVEGSVAVEVSVVTTGCTPASVTIGEIIPAADPWKTAQANGGGTCTIQFGTTNSSFGANLAVLEDPGAPAAPADALKCIGGGCGSSAISDYSGAGEPGIGTSAFGAQLLSASGGATGVWAVAPAVSAIADAASTACQTNATGTGTCNFTFGATASATDSAGSYEARVQYVALAR